MRRLIFSTNNIYGMSTKRTDAKDAIKALQPALIEHLCKCVVYGDKLRSLNFWIKELASFLDEANSVNSDKRGHKFSKSTYEDLLFGQFGNDISDKIRILKHFASTEIGKKDLPHSSVTLEMIDALVYVSTQLRDRICPLLATKNQLTSIDFRKIIESIFIDAGILE